jgi:hypothetical protein
VRRDNTCEHVCENLPSGEGRTERVARKGSGGRVSRLDDALRSSVGPTQHGRELPKRPMQPIEMPAEGTRFPAFRRGSPVSCDSLRPISICAGTGRADGRAVIQQVMSVL